MPRLRKGSDLTLFDDVGKKARSSKHKDRKCPCAWNSHLHVISVSLLFIFVHPPKFSPKNLLKNPNPQKNTQKSIATLDIWPSDKPSKTINLTSDLPRTLDFHVSQGRVFTSLGTFKSSIASLHTLLFHLRILETICWCDWLFWLWWDSGDVFFWVPGVAVWNTFCCFLLVW